jgi:hypothetical protein
MVPVSLLSHCLVSPQEGHLQQTFHIFAYIKQFNRARLVFDDTMLDFGGTYFHMRCYHTGLIIYVNNAPIIWFSKR